MLFVLLIEVTMDLTVFRLYIGYASLTVFHVTTFAEQGARHTNRRVFDHLDDALNRSAE